MLKRIVLLLTRLIARAAAVSEQGREYEYEYEYRGAEYEYDGADGSVPCGVPASDLRPSSDGPSTFPTGWGTQQ